METDIHIPHTIKECFVELDKMLSEEDKKTIIQLGDKSSLDSLHFSLGMAIRNLFQIWTNEPLLEYFANKSKYHSVHPDDVSGKILNEYYEYLKQKS